jgi:hypothetical protein
VWSTAVDDTSTADNVGLTSFHERLTAVNVWPTAVDGWLKAFVSSFTTFSGVGLTTVRKLSTLSLSFTTGIVVPCFFNQRPLAVVRTLTLYDLHDPP